MNMTELSNVAPWLEEAFCTWYDVVLEKGLNVVLVQVESKKRWNNGWAPKDKRLVAALATTDCIVYSIQ